MCLNGRLCGVLPHRGRGDAGYAFLCPPKARELLSWYEIDLDAKDMSLNLGRLNACYEVDFEDVQAELQTFLDDDDYLPMSYDPRGWPQRRLWLRHR